MKNIKNIITKGLIFGMIMSFAACDYLETTPYDFAAPQTFYKNKQECTYALAGVYWTLATENVYGNRYSAMLSDIDDLSYYTRKNQTGQVFANSHNASNRDVWLTWQELYSGINNANILLESIDKADMDDAARARIKGEAKFLRAYYHFLLVQGWYEVPVREHSVDNIHNAGKEATPHVEAINWIIKEMEECLPLVDDKEYDKSPSHVKKATVEGILARVYLWKAGVICNGGKEAYQKAAEYAKAVIDSKKHDLNPDVYALWMNMARDKYDAKYNESIWEVEFIGTKDDGRYNENRLGNVLGNLQDDGSRDGKGYSYGFYAGSLILWDLFSENDARRDLSMAPYKYDKKGEKINWSDKQIVDRRCGKYRREWEIDKPQSKNNTPANFCILRYADVLLMYAEAMNEVNNGPTAEAYAAINKVRTRAGVEELSGLSYDQFKQAVRDERARELCFESTRKYDLVRWGIYYQAIHGDLLKATEDKRWTKNYFTTGGGEYAANTAEKHQFLPIPSRELSVNTLLKQNKYWQ